MIAIACAVLYQFTDMAMFVMHFVTFGYLFAVGAAGNKQSQITTNGALTDVRTALLDIRDVDKPLPKLVLTLYSIEILFFVIAYLMASLIWVSGALFVDALILKLAGKSVDVTTFYIGLSFAGLAILCCVGALRIARKASGLFRKDSVTMTPEKLHIEMTDNHNKKVYDINWHDIKDIHEQRGDSGVSRNAIGYVKIITQQEGHNDPQNKYQTITLATDSLHYSPQEVGGLFIAYQSRALGKPIKIID